MKGWIMRLFLVLAETILFVTVGCERPAAPSFDWNKYPAVAAPAKHDGIFSMLSSNEGTFLLDANSGKVWKFSAKDNALLEIPVTSKILTYNPKTGKLEPDQTTEKNSSGKPCDKKTDPLCIM